MHFEEGCLLFHQVLGADASRGIDGRTSRGRAELWKKTGHLGFLNIGLLFCPYQVSLSFWLTHLLRFLCWFLMSGCRSVRPHTPRAVYTAVSSANSLGYLTCQYICFFGKWLLKASEYISSEEIIPHFDKQ